MANDGTARFKLIVLALFTLSISCAIGAFVAGAIFKSGGIFVLLMMFSTLSTILMANQKKYAKTPDTTSDKFLTGNRGQALMEAGFFIPQETSDDSSRTPVAAYAADPNNLTPVQNQILNAFWERTAGIDWKMDLPLISPDKKQAAWLALRLEARKATEKLQEDYAMRQISQEADLQGEIDGLGIPPWLD